MLVGDDTDLLVLLCYHAHDTAHHVFFRPESRSNVKKRPKSWNITTTRATLGSLVCCNILFTHAILGCDTTSHIFGLGKRIALTRLKRSRSFVEQSNTFSSSSASQENIIRAGEKALVSLYNGVDSESINELRLRRFCDKTSSSNAPVHPRSLPRTANATKFHSLKVYHQVQSWMGRPIVLDPTEWGWKVVNGCMIQQTMDTDPAPQDLLDVIRCSCKTGCDSFRCSCRKNDLECTLACGECCGVCSNMSLNNIDSEEEVDIAENL